jgi:hypothetical protein
VVEAVPVSDAGTPLGVAQGAWSPFTATAIKAGLAVLPCALGRAAFTAARCIAMTETTRYFAAGWDFDEERARLRLIEEINDPATTCRLSSLGLTSGWRCLELGAGAGSIACWMAERVAPSGH